MTKPITVQKHPVDCFMCAFGVKFFNNGLLNFLALAYIRALIR